MGDSMGEAAKQTVDPGGRGLKLVNLTGYFKQGTGEIHGVNASY